MGSILGGLLGGGSSPGQAAQEQALRNATEAYKQYRPEAMQARLNAMGTISNAYQGANNALETMWGNKPQGAPQGFAGFQSMKAAPMPEAGQFKVYRSETDVPVEEHHRRRHAGPDVAGMLVDPLNLFGGF